MIQTGNGIVVSVIGDVKLTSIRIVLIQPIAPPVAVAWHTELFAKRLPAVQAYGSNHTLDCVADSRVFRLAK